MMVLFRCSLIFSMKGKNLYTFRCRVLLNRTSGQSYTIGASWICIILCYYIHAWSAAKPFTELKLTITSGNKLLFTLLFPLLIYWVTMKILTLAHIMWKWQHFTFVFYRNYFCIPLILNLVLSNDKQWQPQFFVSHVSDTKGHRDFTFPERIIQTHQHVGW